jgi:hypothetical protein
MKRIMLVSLGALAVLAVASGIAYSSGGGPSGGDRVYGGGRLCVVPDCSNNRDFSVDVHANPSGKTLIGDFATSRGANPVDAAEVTCARVEGNKAVIGGFVREGGAELLGLPFVMYFIDNGPPSSAVDDRASLPFFLGPTDTFPGEPADFPNTCPSSVDAFDPTLYRDVVSGDIRVIDGHG